MVLEDATIKAYAMEILQCLKEEKGKDELHQLLKNMLRSRHLEEEIDKALKQFISLHKEDFEKRARALPLRTGDNSAFLQVHFDIPYVPEKKLMIYEIVYKEYFTPEFKENNALAMFEHSLRFLYVMPELAHHLEQLARQEESWISFKFPYSLKTMLTSTDTLIVYYAKKELGKKIQQLTQAVLADHDIHALKRKNRPQSAFDYLHDTVAKDMSSHTNSVASVLLTEILAQREKLSTLAPQQVAVWIKEKLAEVHALDEKELLRALHS